MFLSIDSFESYLLCINACLKLQRQKDNYKCAIVLDETKLNIKANLNCYKRLHYKSKVNKNVSLNEKEPEKMF